jgi:hypothetical protein
MATMGKYCKAYLVRDLRTYPHWKERAENVRPSAREVDGGKPQAIRTLTDDDFLFVQEDYTVTDGIFLNEHVIFDEVTREWQVFCGETLKFEIPVYEPIAVAEPETTSTAPQP